MDAPAWNGAFGTRSGDQGWPNASGHLPAVPTPRPDPLGALVAALSKLSVTMAQIKDGHDDD